jgi:heme-transporting ATPase
MTTLISAQSLRLDTNHGLLFQDLSLTLRAGERIGLLGHNGCGKSTLLALLSGALEPSGGALHRAHACRLQHVEQHLPAALAQLRVREVLAEAAPDSPWRVDSLLDRLGLSAQADQGVSTLSGGQHTRLLLGRALLQEPNVLLLDEPSNHLDLPSLLWLEDFLRGWSGAFVLVSHDRRLLDNATGKSWILRDQRLYDFDLPCSAARAALFEQDRAAGARHAAEQKEIDRLAASSHRLAVWGKTYDNEDLARKAKTMQKRVDRLKEEQSFVTQGPPWRLALRGRTMAADQLLALEDVVVRAAPGLPPLFAAPHAVLRAGERVALLGANGAGKSSLLRLCWAVHREQDDVAGLKLHGAAGVGYYDQGLRQLADEATLADALAPFARQEARSDVALRQALISAGFPYARHGQRVATLSGGERARLLFLALSLASHHLLLLDEPTNHLDLDGKEELAEALLAFEGGCLLVSHDRELVERACNRFWVVHEGRLEQWQDAADAFARLGAPAVPETPGRAAAHPAPSAAPAGNDQEALLATLCELEQRLIEDLARKPRHQKPAMQQCWREQIATLSQQLGLA